MNIQLRVKRPKGPPLKANDQVTRWVLRCLVQEGLCTLLVCTHDGPYLLQDLGITVDGRLSPKRQAAEVERAILDQLRTEEAEGVDRSRPVFANVAALGRLLHLDDAAQELLALAVLLDGERALALAMELLGRSCRRKARQFVPLLSRVIGQPAESVRLALAPEGVLAGAGLLTFSMARVREHESPVHASALAIALLDADEVSADTLADRLVERSQPAELTLADYPHVAAEVVDLRAYLGRVLATHRGGVNVLLYGQAGTGKTQLARALAQDLGASLFQVRVAGEGGTALPRKERFASLQLTQALLANRLDALVLFDEAEDVFPPDVLQLFGGRDTQDKGWVNRLLEENPIPVVWLSNQVAQIDPAYLRRFDVVLELPVPPRSQRRRMLAREVQDLGVSDHWLDRWAADPDVTPADIVRAARVAHDIGGPDPEKPLTRLLDQHLLVRRGPRPPSYRPPLFDYDLTFVNPDLDPFALADGLRRLPSAALLFHGPPGSGKTALAHWLARDLDRPLVHKWASDLLGRYVGETESRLAAMFREATHENAVLLLDEADGFLRDRRAAKHSWEVTQVSELLVQMEAFDGVFVCATNLLDQVDPAALRRFAVKVHFRPLTPEQREQLLCQAVVLLGGTDLEGLVEEARRLDEATVGDFVAGVRRFVLLGTAPSPAALAAVVREEVRLRVLRSRRAGFEL